MQFLFLIVSGGISLYGDNGFFFSWSDPEYLGSDYVSMGTEHVHGYWFIDRVPGMDTCLHILYYYFLKL